MYSKTYLCSENNIEFNGNDLGMYQWSILFLHSDPKCVFDLQLHALPLLCQVVQ